MKKKKAGADKAGAVFCCPKCGATPNEHGKGDCRNRRFECTGFLCECDFDEESDAPDHGVSLSNPCSNAQCDHCGWSGTVPVNRSKLLAWEKKALDAGWTMPEARAKELESK